MTVNNVPTGAVHIVARKDGFRPVNREVFLGPDDDVSVEFGALVRESGLEAKLTAGDEEEALQRKANLAELVSAASEWTPAGTRMPVGPARSSCSGPRDATAPASPSGATDRCRPEPSNGS